MTVTLEVDDSGIGILLVNRPEARNALNWHAMEKFAACVAQAEETPDLKALILAGAGQSFISGGDLKELHQYSKPEDARHLTVLMGDALYQLEHLPCPVIAALNGTARGGGVEIALACDLRVAAADASLGLVQINLGLTPGWGTVQRLLRLVGYSRAFDLLTTGRIIQTAEALELGLVNRIAPAGSALNAAIEMAQQLSRQPQQAVRALKRILQSNYQLPAEQARLLEQDEFIPLWVSEEHHLAVEQFLHARKAK